MNIIDSRSTNTVRCTGTGTACPGSLPRCLLLFTGTVYARPCFCFVFILDVV